MIELLLVIWYVIGLLGCALGIWTDLKRGENFTLADLFVSLIASVGGLVLLMCTIDHYIKHNRIQPIVLIKGKK
jgi:hypothetical protein